MPDPTADLHQSAVLKAFARAGAGGLSSSKLKGLIKGPLDASGLDRTLGDLIERGQIEVKRGGKTGPHPRAGATYSLTPEGAEHAKDHARPPKPEIPEEALGYQKAFILLQFFKADGRLMSRSDLNARLKSNMAIGTLEFDPKKKPGVDAPPSAIEFQLHQLVEEGSLEARKVGAGFSYTMTADGLAAFLGSRQHTEAQITLKGSIINALLAAAAEVAGGRHNARLSEVAPPSDRPATVGMDDILSHLDRLRAEEYRGGVLVPIHALRRRVAAASGELAAGHDSLDPLLKRMRVENHIRLVAINVLGDASPEELEASIPGMNETLFFID